MTHDDRDRAGDGNGSEGKQLRREVRRWKRLFAVTLVALVVFTAYFTWLGWELGHRIDRMEADLATERSLVIAERCLETLRACTESRATATRLLWGAIRPVELEKLPHPEAEETPGQAAAGSPPAETP